MATEAVSTTKLASVTGGMNFVGKQTQSSQAPGAAQSNAERIANLPDVAKDILNAVTGNKAEQVKPVILTLVENVCNSNDPDGIEQLGKLLKIKLPQKAEKAPAFQPAPAAKVEAPAQAPAAETSHSTPGCRG